MAKKVERGTKRTCQNPECGSRFYDLNRDPIVCPICETVYRIASAPAATAAVPAAAVAAAEKIPRKVKKPEADPVLEPAAENAPETEAGAETALAEGEERPIAGQTDETFFEPDEEEDGGDVSGIIGGPVAEDEEET